MDVESTLRKKARLRKQEKRRYAKTSGTLAGQISRTRTARGYRGTGKAIVTLKMLPHRFAKAD